MNKSIKTFACVAMVSMLLLSCNDTTGLNPSSGDDNNTAATKGNELKQSPNGTTSVIIADDVQKWMEEQLASKGGEKRLISISDMHRSDVESDAGLSATRSSDGKEEYFLNGKKISVEEYTSIIAEYRQKTDYGKRNLSIPGKIIYNTPYDWTVLMTAEEIAEFLSKKYDSLLIEFYIEPVNE